MKAVQYLKWSFHQELSRSVLEHLLSDKDSSDVTLVAEDKSIDVHRFVLTYASSFFRDIFQNNPEKHLTLHLQGLRYETLQNLVRYIYMGEVSIKRESYGDFISNAEKWNLVQKVERKTKTIEIKATPIDEKFISQDKTKNNEDTMENYENVAKAHVSDLHGETIGDDSLEKNLTDSTGDVSADVPCSKKSKLRFECDLCDKVCETIVNLLQHKQEHKLSAIILH